MRTTININSDLLERLKNTSNSLKISTDDLITILVKIVLSKNIFEAIAFRSVKYQSNDPQKNWSKHHVTLKPQAYEQDLDIRKCFKYSFSFVISYAIIHFLDEIIKKLIKSKNKYQEVDNYPLNYIFITKNYNGIKGFIVLWGIPEEKYLENILL